jgi:hypothetical protein
VSTVLLLPKVPPSKKLSAKSLPKPKLGPSMTLLVAPWPLVSALGVHAQHSRYAMATIPSSTSFPCAIVRLLVVGEWSG